MSDLELLETLRRVPVLRHLPLAALDRMVSQSELREFPPGSVLIEEGAPGDEVFVLVEGRVAVRASLSEREERAIGTRGPGDLVGEMALLDDLPRSASVTAEGEVRALCVPRAAFLECRRVPRRARPSTWCGPSRCASARATRRPSRCCARRPRRLASTNRRLSRENRRLRVALDDRFGFEQFVGGSPAAEAIRSAARRAAESELPGAARRRDRHRQGARRAGHPRRERAARAALRGGELRAVLGGAARERALRPRPRGVHRRPRGEAGPRRGRRRRHPVPRRARRHAPRRPRRRCSASSSSASSGASARPTCGAPTCA